MMYRKNISTLATTSVVICILSLQFRLIFPFIDYTLHKEYVQSVLCINKYRPELHCNGKCVLALRIQKEMDAERSASQPYIPQPEKNKIQPLEIVDKSPCEWFYAAISGQAYELNSESATTQWVLSPVSPPPRICS